MKISPNFNNYKYFVKEVNKKTKPRKTINWQISNKPEAPTTLKYKLYLKG